ncbi:MAG: hypothetical protein AB7F98_04855 [Novosphingobium sp.]
MRYPIISAALALATLSSGTIVTTSMAAETAAAPKYSTSKSTIGVLMADPEAKAILMKIIPEFAQAGDSPGGDFERASGMTLPELKAAVGQYAPNMITDARLTQLDEELEKLGATQPAPAN